MTAKTEDARSATTLSGFQEDARSATLEEDARSATISGFQDILQKCEASLMPAIEEHVENEAFDSAKDGLDFLEVIKERCSTKGFLYTTNRY